MVPRLATALAATTFVFLTGAFALGAQTDLQKLEGVAKKVTKLHCLCASTESNPDGLGTVTEFAGVAPGGRTYVGMRCSSPAFDGTGTATGGTQCTSFQVLPK